MRPLLQPGEGIRRRVGRKPAPERQYALPDAITNDSPCSGGAPVER